MKIEILNKEVMHPTRGSEYAAGIDIYSPIDFIISGNEREKILLGISVEINKDEVLIMSERSSMAKNGIHSIGNVIDSDYRGEISIVLRNSSTENHSFSKGDRIGQMLVHKLGDNSIEIVDKLSETSRGAGGFGSTGK